MNKLPKQLKTRYLTVLIMLLSGFVLISGLIHFKSNLQTAQAHIASSDIYAELNSNDINLSNKKHTLIWFSAHWCSFCATMKDYVHDLTAQVGDKLQFVELDIDENAQLAALLGVKDPPQFLLYNDKGDLQSSFEFETQPSFAAKLASYLN